MSTMNELMAVKKSTCLLMLAFVTYAAAQYSIDLQLSAESIVAGGQVTVTCDVTNQPNTSFTLVWVRRRHHSDDAQLTSTSGTSSVVAAAELREEENIGSNGHLEEQFDKSGRYSVKYEIIKKLTRVKFMLTITDLKAIDSGSIGCRIPLAKIDAFRPFSVLVPVQSIRLTSRNSESTHAQSYLDGETITFADDESRYVVCQVNGSHPAANVRVVAGDLDVTEQFVKTSQLSGGAGWSNSAAGQDVYYITEIYQPAMRIGFELSGKPLRCIATVPGSNFTAVSTHIIVAFDSYRPKFINCSGPRVEVSALQTDVRLECNVQAQPPITDAWIKWPRSQSNADNEVILGAGKRDGHFYLDMRPQSTSNDLLNVVSLNVDKIYPQHFNNYTFVAKNSEGVSETRIQLVRRDIQATNGVNFRFNIWVTTTLALTSFTITCFFSWY